MIVETLLLGVLYGKLKGGSFGNLSDLSINMWGFIMYPYISLQEGIFYYLRILSIFSLSQIFFSF